MADFEEEILYDLDTVLGMDDFGMELQAKKAVILALDGCRWTIFCIGNCPEMIGQFLY
jgi:hypothetical protein